MTTLSAMHKLPATSALSAQRKPLSRTDLGSGIRFVGKCKCGNGLSHLATAFVTHGFDQWLEGASVTHMYDNGACIIPCSCGRRMRIYEVRGKFSEKHKCNAKCLASKTGICECSCGGKNHGASWG